jgi:hypothetical protein
MGLSAWGGTRCIVRYALRSLVLLSLVAPAWSADSLRPEADASLFAAPEVPPPPQDAGVTESSSLWTTSTPTEQEWTLGYQTRWMTNSVTSYEFGWPEGGIPSYSPVSRLEFPLNALWHGLDVRLRKPEWELQFQWLTPVNDHIQGRMEDRDWMIEDADITDLGITRERWLSGQMIDLGLNLRLWDRCLGLPVDCWGTTGFRWQRFDIMAFDLAQVKQGNVWPPSPYTYAGDVISFDQQYWLSYLGGQLRGALNVPVGPPIHWTVQLDWANAQAYNIDHHLLRTGDRYTMERTHGGAWHLALATETFLTPHLSVGLQADYLGIETHGTHHWLNIPEGDDETWTNGVHVWSQQTSLTAFVGFRI